MTESYSLCRQEAEDVIKLQGEIDIYHLDDLHDCLKDRFMSDQDLTIDCQEVEQMDMAAIQLLTAFKKSFSQRHKLKIINIPPALEKVWEITGVKKILLNG